VRLLAPFRPRIRIPPPFFLALVYALLIVVGSLLLKLPLASEAPLSWLEAIFTATSAITVTGLTVIATGPELTFVGQLVVLVLIQLGGLGLMTIAVMVLAVLGLPVALPQQLYLRADLSQTSLADLLRLVLIILQVVVVCQLVGTIVLAFVFVPEFGWWPGLWHALFHAISAFNNAGFTLFPDSLTRWATHPVINLGVPALFIIGGIGFPVLCDLVQNRRWRRFSLHTKLMLVGTAALIAWSVPTFATTEWTNPATLGAFDSTTDKLAASWFQALTTRTAGFYTLDIAAVHDSTALMFILLMVVGGGSASTAGGVKVTTLVVLLLATLAFFRRRTTIDVFGRNIGHHEITKILALSVLGVLTILLGLFVILAAEDGPFLDLAFEVASAFGTVGLSRGATEDLGSVGQLVLVALMFVGRIGPLVLGFFLGTRVPPRVRHPADKVFLG